MFLVKVLLDDPRLTLTTPKKASHIRNELLLIVSTLTSHGIALYVLIEHLVRIQLRTVSREEEQPHLFPLSGSPRLHLGTPVDRMTIEDQKHHALALADQAPEEIDQHFAREALLEHHEVELPSVGERGNHVAPKALTGSQNHGRLAPPAIGTPGCVIRPQSHLVRPVDRGMCCLRLGSDARILLLQPTTYRLRVSLQSPPHRFLRGKPPAAEISPYGPHRKPNAESPLDQLRNRFSSPKKKGQLPLFWRSINDGFGDLRSLPWQKRSPLRTPSALRLQLFSASSPVSFDPFAHRLAGHTKQLGNLHLLRPVQNRIDCLLAKVRLSNTRERTSIYGFHDLQYTCMGTECQLFYALSSKNVPRPPRLSGFLAEQ